MSVPADPPANGSAPTGAGQVAAPASVRLDPAQLTDAVARLQQAQSQLDRIIEMMEGDRTCADIVAGMTAVTKSLDKVGFAVIAAGLKQCLVEQPDSEAMNSTALEKLFLSLA